MLLEIGIIDRTGRFVEVEVLKDKLPDAVISRLIEVNGQPAFCLTENKDQKVILTQEDIRQTQLAKAAIRAGITLLQKKIRLSDMDIEKVLLAGAFGNYIRAESAIAIGLLPGIPAERIIFVGNAACSGAQMLLLSEKARAKAKILAEKIEYIEIANQKDFTDVYAESMMF